MNTLKLMIMKWRKLGVLSVIAMFFYPVYASSRDIMKGFMPHFTILYSPDDPNLAMRSAGITDVNYNVATWKTYPGKVSDLPISRKNAATAGDGFDDRILEAQSSGRTVSLSHAAAEVIEVQATGSEQRGDTLFYYFPANDGFDLTAYLLMKAKPYPKLHFDFLAKQGGWYSVGYTGAPAKGLDEV